MAATKAASANKTRMLFIFEPVLLRWMFTGNLKMLPKFEHNIKVGITRQKWLAHTSFASMSARA
jgi:hypothetical protein